jgi:hypothetical protein
VREALSNYWKKVAVAVDLWLLVRWHALLTWLLLGGVTFWIVRQRWLYFEVYDFALRATAEVTSRTGLSIREDMLRMAGTAGMIVWYQPVVLRLGILRGAAWMTIAAIGWGMTCWIPDTGVSMYSPIVAGIITGLTGLAAIGRRRRVWLAFVGGALDAVAIQATFADKWSAWLVPWYCCVVLGWALAIVMIYGTDPISKAAAQRDPET